MRREKTPEISVIEGGAGVGFTGRGDVLVGGDAVRGEGGAGGEKDGDKCGKRLVLLQGVRVMVAAGDFDADGEVVALVAAAKMRDAGMPGATVNGGVLADVAIAGDVEMSGNAQVGDGIEVGMVMAEGRQGAEE